MEINPLQVYLEKVLKDYLNIKEKLESFLLKENIEKVKNDIAEKSAGMTEDELEDYTFEKMGWITALNNDLIQFKMQLYFTWVAYKDLIEPPKEIKNTIEKELDQVVFKTTFSVVGGEVTLVDKGLLEEYKKQYKATQDYYKKQMNGAGE